MQSKAMVGVLDVETTPLVAYAWGRHDVNIAITQIVTDWRIMTFAFKWLGAKKVFYYEARTDKDEHFLLAQLWEFLDVADIVVTQNGKAFDAKKINARFIMNGMKPPSPFKHLDTYLIAKNAAAFTANSLEYLTDKLCTKYKKLSHSKFPGMSLWSECLKGNKAAWAEMKRYNIHDVLATEELYGKLKAWAPVNAPKVFMVGCSACGHSLTKNGVVAGVQRLRCLNCGRSSGAKLKVAS
jgi:RNase H-like protein